MAVISAQKESNYGITICPLRAWEITTRQFLTTLQWNDFHISENIIQPQPLLAKLAKIQVDVVDTENSFILLLDICQGQDERL